MRALMVACMISLVAGCAVQPERAPPDPLAVEAAWATHQQALAGVRGFQALGRVAIKGRGLSGSLRWNQDGEAFSLRIAGPFGVNALAIDGTPQLVAIRGKEIDVVTNQPQDVLANRTGWRLPLDALRWWALGLPAPGPVDAVLLDAEGHATSFAQRGWTLSFSSYQRDPAAPAALPARIVAHQLTTIGEWQATISFESMVLTP